MNRQSPMMKAARKMALGILLGAASVPSVLAQDVTVNGGYVYQKIEGMGLLLDTNSNTPPSSRMMSQLYSSPKDGQSQAVVRQISQETLANTISSLISFLPIMELLKLSKL